MTKQLITAVFMLITFPALVNAHDVTAPESLEQHTFDTVSPNIHVIQGTQSLPSPETRGFMNNPAIITAKNGVIVIDPGSSREIGIQLLEKIKTVSDKPVIAVFNTHIHGDHWLGNHGIRSVYPDVPIYAHERMIERVNGGEGLEYIDIFLRMTEQATAGTESVAPNIGLRGGEIIKFEGVTLRIYHTGHAHTDSDIMIEVIEDKGLFFGDIVASERVPNSDIPRDAHFKGTIKAIETILASNTTTLFIPGHGKSGGREVPEASLQFLRTLVDSVTRYYKKGLSDYEMKDKVINELAEFKDWNNFNEIGRVISHVYQEVEQEEFGSQP